MGCRADTVLEAAGSLGGLEQLQWRDLFRKSLQGGRPTLGILSILQFSFKVHLSIIVPISDVSSDFSTILITSGLLSLTGLGLAYRGLYSKF